jgi:hypothetical protein
MQGTESSAASNAEQVAHQRTAVERWLAWSGLVPLPIFLCLHVARELGLAFARDVAQVVRPAPGAFALVSSALLVWLPLLAHGALGAWLMARGRERTARVDDVAPLWRSLSRWSALAALSFILYHAAEFPLAVLRGQAAPEDAGFRLITRLSSTSQGVPLAGALYLLGLLATSTHAGLAVHRALLGEGFLASAERRRRSGRLCATFAVLSFMLGAAAVIRVATGVLLR